MVETQRNPGLAAFIALVLAVGIGNGLAHFGTSSMPFQVGAVMDGRHLSATQGGIFGFFEVGSLALIMLVLSPVIDQFRPMRIGLAGAGLSCAAHLLMFVFDPGFPVLCTLAAAAGAGYGLLYAAVITGASGSHNADRIYALGSSATLLVIVLLMMTLPFAGQAFGPFGIFLGMSIILLFSSPFLIGFKGIAPHVNLQQRGSVLRQGGAKPLLILWSLFSFGTGALWSFAERIGRHIDLQPEAIGFILSASTFCGLAGTFAAAMTAGRVNRLWAIAIGLVGSGVGCAILGVSASIVAYSLGVLLYWIFYMYLYAYLLGTAAALDSSGRIGTAGGGCERLAFALGAPVGGLVVDYSSYALLGIIAAALCIAALPLCLPSLKAALARSDEDNRKSAPTG